MHAMIFAAGLGTRLKPHTDFSPKPCIPFLNLPLINYPIHQLLGVGIKRLVVNTHHFPTHVEHVVTAALRNTDVELIFSDEQPKILDSGGGLYRAKPHLDDDSFIVANSDATMLFS